MADFRKFSKIEGYGSTKESALKKLKVSAIWYQVSLVGWEYEYDLCNDVYRCRLKYQPKTLICNKQKLD